MTSHLEQQLAGLQINHGDIQGGRKVGPAVPPKPKKPQPQVPKSYSLNNQCEPSYSTLLQSGSNASQQVYTNLPPPAGANCYPSYVPKFVYLDLPAHSTGGMLDAVNHSLSSHATYSNIDPPRANTEPHLIYSNVGAFGAANSVEDLPPPPPEPAEYSNQCPAPNFPPPPADDLPPPPSPVSSSYSELRRATYQPNYQPEYGTYGPSSQDLPPPPPEPAEYSNQCPAPNFPPPPADDLPPPPSPVSSSYSELRRATYQPNYQPEYGTYGPSSQSSSTYESIYEPINPRPPSQMSSRSNYSLYAPYASGTQGKGSCASGQTPSGGKEAEVDALTDLLVQSMDGSADSDIYGVCTACGERVVGEGSGCTAMDQVYHIACFTCQHCAIQLQGKPFYALEGKPYCEEDYLNTLEKCSVCMKPILDRILRATGKPYHPQCFSCIVCGKSLDGIPFTVDATNQIHCIEDFHRKFAPRCCVCKLPIMPEVGKEETVRVVALDRSFHIACYKCEDCGLVLSSEAEGRGCYPLDDHVLCKSCNAKRVQALTSHMTTEL